jgi:Predicted nucleic acid-binding protein, contains PIN domain
MEENSKKTYVIDSSFILAYLLPDEEIEKVQKLFDKYKLGGVNLLSTVLLPFEVVNGIHAATLSKRIDQEVAMQLIDEFLKLPILFEDVNFTSCFNISYDRKISVYDASYVLLSRIEGVLLLTLDKKLKSLT